MLYYTKFDFIVKQFLNNECSITLETLDKIKYGFVEDVVINAPWQMYYGKNRISRNSTPANYACLLKVLEVAKMKPKRP